MKKVRWGLLSTANINRRLIPAIRNSRRAELVAVASRDKNTALDYARKWGIPHAFGDYAEMLNSGTVDIVYISLPNHMHAEWTIRALEAGVHVLCEKPAAINLEQIDAMIEASQRTGCVLTEAFMYRHHPQTKVVGEWIRTGRLGDVLLVRSAFNFLVQPQHDIRLVPEFGGGSLWDVGVYPLSFAQYVYDSSPVWVDGAQILGERGVDESFSGLMQYSGGGMALISSSFRSPFHIFAEITGTEGRLVLNRPFTAMEDNRRLYFYPSQGDRVEIPVQEQELYSGEVEDMHAAILDNQPTYVSLNETRNHVKTVVALLKSALENRRIYL